MEISKRISDTIATWERLNDYWKESNTTVRQKPTVLNAGHLLRRLDQDHDRFSAFESDIPHPRLNPVRRVGTPRINWAVDTMTRAWLAHRGGRTI